MHIGTVNSCFSTQECFSLVDLNSIHSPPTMSTNHIEVVERQLSVVRCPSLLQWALNGGQPLVSFKGHKFYPVNPYHQRPQFFQQQK